MNLRDQLNGLAIPVGGSKRSDCPFCGGSNSFSCTNNGGVLLYNCYKASCNKKGSFNSEFYSANDAEKQLNYKSTARKETSFQIPSYFRSLDGDVERYLDVKENRTVYIVRDKLGRVCDAVGRTNIKGVSPKWKRYGDSGLPFIAGKFSGTVVVVEDCISACAVAKTGDFTGLALLGTNVTPESNSIILSFDRCLVALDPDATSKSVDIARKLSWQLPTFVVKLKNDLKYFNTEEVRNILNSV